MLGIIQQEYNRSLGRDGFGLITPYAARSLQPPDGVWGPRFADASSDTTARVYTAGVVILMSAGAALGAGLGAKRSRGWAAGGAVLGLLGGSITSRVLGFALGV